MPERKTIVIDTYTKQMVNNLLKWIRNDHTANNLFNYRQVKEDGSVVTEQEIIDMFIANNNLTSKKFPIGYSILNNTEN